MDINVILIAGGVWIGGGLLVAAGWYWFKHKR